MKLGINKEELVQRLNSANTEDKSQAIVDVINDMVASQTSEIEARYQVMAAEVQADAENRKKYGLRTLSQTEKAWLQRITDTKQLTAAFPTADHQDLIPETVVNFVFEDLKQAHPILSRVSWSPAGVKKWLLSEKSGVATWGALDAAITSAITADISTLDIMANKLSAYAFIPNGLIDLGYEFVERYVREVLAEVAADGLEKGVIVGTGKDQPIGLVKKLSGAVDGVYPDRVAVAINDFSATSLGTHMATLSNNGERVVGKVLLIVNPIDDFTLVAPASIYRTSEGDFRKSFPFDIEVVQSVHVPSKKGILYIPKAYQLGATEMGLSYSDHYQFLEDGRTYKVRTYGNGRLVHENQAVVLDITNLAALPLNVNVVNTTTAPVNTKEVA